MSCATSRFASWLRPCLSTPLLHVLSRPSARLGQRAIHSTSLSLSYTLPAISASLSSSLVPIYRTAHSHQLVLHPRSMQHCASADSALHRCTPACSHHAVSRTFTLPRSTRTVMSAIDAPSTSAASTSAVALSLLEPATLPLLAPSPAPVADVPLECAVPKRKPSPRAQRHRRAGQRATHARRLHQTYRVCMNCGSPVKPHYLCIRCRQVIGRF